MTYRLEVAFNFRHNKDVNGLKNDLINTANRSGCENYYTDIELMGCGRTTTRNHMVMVFHFPDKAKYIISFLNRIKNNRNVYIESIGYDNISFTLLYASKIYLNMMDKSKAREYLTTKNSFTNIEFQNIIRAI